ncbi:septation protein SepH [Actinomyces sp. MRS3W]|uniref:septation protein SepH n=1 Tax=Actinomyces sp. MRS3W TaxID=2800796 RepID=UPI0028FD5ECF|nr:septation protein SepH [Actinomyces sp. MRS3W]MDU0347538.1 septation protein SepH [Actinomyces sp. MRS3W]
MIELELLGANGDTIVMTDSRGERYSMVVDDAVRAAVRRARPAALTPTPQTPPHGTNVRPRELQALMRAGASAEEVAAATGLDSEHVRRFEGPVIAERLWAVQQAQACRIGWEKDSPVLGELAVDRLATRGVEPSSLEWDALREGREPWQIVLTFVQGAQAKQAHWELDLTARSVSALDDEARWLTEAGSSRRPTVFDQDSEAPGASSAPSPASAEASPPPDSEADSTDALLADLASNRGRRVEAQPPQEEVEAPVESPDTPPQGQAQVVSMSERRRAHTGNHPAGSRLRAPAASPTPDSEAEPPTQEALPEMPPAPAGKQTKRRTRRSVPSWDEIVFGSKPE